MAGEIGRFSAIIGADGSQLTRTLNAAGSQISAFAKNATTTLGRITSGGAGSANIAQGITAGLPAANVQIQQTAQGLAGVGNAAKQARSPVNQLTSSLLRQALAYASLRAAANLLRGAFDAADAQETAARKLRATAALTGESTQNLTRFAKEARDGLALPVEAAADLTSQLTRLTAQTGNTAQTGQLLVRWMDLAAARGLTLDETLQTIQSTLLGQDEGLNRLGLSNPSQIYEKWARGAGLVPSALSDAQKAQAIVNAVLTEGTKVSGEYQRSLNTAAGKQQQFRKELDDTAASFGRLVQGQREFATEGATSLLRVLRVLIDMDDTIEGMPAKFKLLAAGITGGAGGLAAALAQQERDIAAATEKAAKERAAAQRKFFQGPPAPRSAIKVTADDDTKALAAEIATLKTLHDAQALRGVDVARARELEKQLTATINSGLASRERLAELTKLRVDVRGVLDTSEAVKDLIDKIDALAVAYGLASDNAGRQQAIIPQLVAGYDRVGALLKSQGNQESAISNELRQQLATLKAMDPVIVGLARRQFGSAENIAPVTIPVTGNIVDIRVPTNVKRLAADALEKIAQLPPIPVAIDPTFDPSAISVEFKNALTAARLAKADLDLAGAIGDQKAFAKASDASVAAQKRLKAVAKELADVIRNNPALSDAAKAFGLEAINSQAQSAVTHTTTLGERLQTIADHARGVLSAASAVGVLGDRARLALTNVVDLVDGVGRLSEAIKSGSKGDIFSAVIQSAASATNIAKSIIGDLDGIDKANRELQRSNTEAIVRLSQDLRAFAQTPSQLLNASRAINDNALLNARKATDGFARGFKNVEELDRQLKASGSSLAELKRRAEELGISIVDAKNRITAQGLRDLDIALRLAARKALQFGNTFADQSDAAALRRRVLGQQDDQAAILNDGLKLFKQFAPALYDKFFQGIDTTTTAGREEFRRRLVEFVKEFTSAAGFDASLFPDMDRSQITQIVTDWLDATESMTNAANKAVGAIVNMAEGFALARRVADATRAGANGQTSTSIAAIITRPPTPTPIPITTTGSTTASVSVSFDIGALTLGSSQTKEQIYQDLRRQAIDKARTISPDAVAAVQAALPA